MRCGWEGGFLDKFWVCGIFWGLVGRFCWGERGFGEVGVFLFGRRKLGICWGFYWVVLGFGMYLLGCIGYVFGFRIGVIKKPLSEEGGGVCYFLLSLPYISFQYGYFDVLGLLLFCEFFDLEVPLKFFNELSERFLFLWSTICPFSP